MIKKLGKGILLGIGIAALAKKKIEKDVKRLAKDGKVKDAKKLLNKVGKEAIKEGAKLEKFILGEIKAESEKAEPYLRKAAKKAKKKGKTLAKKAIKKVIKRKR